MNRWALLLASLLAAVGPLAAQQHPNVAKGFAPDKVFAVGDVDSVNAFNGNLLLTIPIGARFPLREGFSYGLSAVYNSNVWDFRDISSGSQSFTQARISRRSNVGAGWRLSLGQLFSPDAKADIAFNQTKYWLYVGPDASEHKFFPTLHDFDPDDPGDTTKVQKVQYSRDGSYLRLKINADGTHTMEFPDGQIHTFNSDRQLTQIRDRFVKAGAPANSLSIAYTPTTWILSDSAGRTQTLTFSNLTQDGLSIQRLDRVDFTSFISPENSGTATWIFQYAAATIPRACPDCADDPYRVNDPVTPDNLTVHFLTGITQPDGSTWSIPLSDYILVNTPLFNDLVGRLQGLKLPTLGRLEWEYGLYPFPAASAPERGPWLTSSRGVVVRRKKAASGGVEGTWTYAPSLLVEGPNQQTKQLTVTVTTPLGDKTENYFSVYSVGDDVAGTPPNILDYGRPFTPKVGDGAGRFLSSRVFDCQPNGTGCVPVRSTWLRYEQDATQSAMDDEGTGAGQILDPRIAQTRTAFEDDCPPGAVGCGVTTPIPPPTTSFYSDEDFSSFDGLGHYRTRNLRGNFPDTTSITETTSYNLARGTYGTPGFSMLPSSAAWLLGLYQDVTRSNNSGENSTVESCFDGSTGFLLRKRVRKFGQTKDDVLVVYTPNGAGMGDGNVGREDWSGGDGGTVPIAELCGLTPPGAAYSLKHTYSPSSAMLTKSEYLKSSGAVFEFAAVDRTVDPRTGLVSAEKDVSKLETTYEYDTLGRLTWVQSAQGHSAWTEYAYTRATNPGSLAKVTINQHANGAKGNAILTTSSLFFDSFGRLIKEQRKMPGAGNFSNRETSYDAIGNRATVSEWEAGVPSNTTQYLDYDPFGRPRTIQPSDGAAHAMTITRSGVRVVTKRTKIWGPCGTGGALQECSSDTVELYDQIGRLFRIDQPVSWPSTTNPAPTPLRTS
ncbi:MAG TPA: hypothetical protein VGS22_16240, partial [Thermoanaerobaculia bacterium]|nr:hypothetical protein [Thermoanaerobaculia bacterium]